MDYTAPMADAVQYIENHWDADLSVADVAAAVHMSPFHFHRVFSAVLGVSVMQFVRAKRLERAAAALRTSQRSIADIALECRFESQATFTRAFVRQLGMSPGRYRKGAWGSDAWFPPRVSPLMGKEDTTMSKVISGPDYEFVGLMLKGLDETVDNTQVIVTLWREMHERVLHQSKVPTFGVCVPGSDCSFDYMAAVERRSLRQLPAGTVSLRVAAHEYAVFTHDEASGPISDAFHRIFRSGLAATGRDYDDAAPDLEVYPGDAFGKQVELEIWIPVR